MNIAVLLFDDFETLDVFGPVEIFGRLTDLYSIKFYSHVGGPISNRHGVSILSECIDDLAGSPDIFLIPGGYGTRKEVNNTALIDRIRKVAAESTYVLTVCTGASLLARTGLLDGKQATTNKMAFAWVMTTGEQVQWNKNARWVVDGKFYTSAGVTAGMDMTLGFLKDIHGLALSHRVAKEIEYCWNENRDDDHFKAEV